MGVGDGDRELLQPRDVEVTIDHATREIRHVVLSTAVLHDDQRKVTGLSSSSQIYRNVKALERNQEARPSTFAIMARFYAGIAHEIRKSARGDL